MRTLLVDNHDSYTFNLFQLIAEVNGVEPVVVVNDDPALATMPLTDFDNIVISPGPGRPHHARDLGHVADLLLRTTLPVLGVCLGHQAIAYLAGGSVGLAPQPRHGHLTTVRHEDDELFAGIPSEFTGVRYHSLCVREPLPAELMVTARAEDGVIMALRHRDLPRWGVQFHPESIASHYGREIIRNFTALTRQANGRPGQAEPVAPATPAMHRDTGPVHELRMISVELPGEADSEAVFLEFFAEGPDCFWLDSSRVEAGLSRFSFLGDASGPLSEVLTYRVDSGAVTVRDAAGARAIGGSVFDVLDARLRQRPLRDPADLPFDLTGGYVGYFGYELKSECGATTRYTADTPDAAWIFADRLVVVDHQENLTYVLALYDERTQAAARAWVDDTAGRLVRLSPAPEPADETNDEPAEETSRFAARHLVRDEAGYQADIRESRRELARGESYEICLTNKVRLPFHDDDTAFYRRLRRLNPAPYSALLRVGDVTVFSSSPERFLRIERDGRVQSRPIKGTAPRHPDPIRDAALAAELVASAKTQAENLMIVDLLRNDLGQVCGIGSVHVDPRLAVESYRTVHQLVATISGQLRPTVSAVDCVRHCFPGGSMTGAPKRRTMEIIDRLETEARGVYSGALGYLGLSGGADLNIVIRTAVRLGDELSVGAGGAIVLDSEVRAEYQEMLLKAVAPLRAYRAPATSESGGAVGSL
ncbi:MAG TPA: aminodeoxychorismate synthase component I [Pseudonocardiaceae bacterium]|nr:aminodeoxychorismate synthase component I [Pseudonocardiaceae bacterium]